MFFFLLLSTIWIIQLNFNPDVFFVLCCFCWCWCIWADILFNLRLLCASFLFLMCWMLERRGYELCSGGCWAELRIKENPPPRPTHMRPSFNIFVLFVQHVGQYATKRILHQDQPTFLYSFFSQQCFDTVSTHLRPSFNIVFYSQHCFNTCPPPTHLRPNFDTYFLFNIVSAQFQYFEYFDVLQCAICQRESSTIPSETKS